MAKHVHTVAIQARRLDKMPRSFRATSDFIFYQSGTLAVVLTTLFVWPFLGRILNPLLLGEISFHLAIASILAPALCLGSHLYLANRIASQREPGIAVEARTAILLSGILYAISVLAIGGSFFLDFQEVLVSAGLTCAVSSYLVTSGVMRGVNRPRLFGLFVFCVQVLGLLGLGWGTGTTDELRSGVLVYVLMVGLPILAQYLMLKKQLTAVRWGSVARVLAKSASLVPHLVLAVALLMMMRVLVAVQLGNQAAANYTFASLIIGGAITVGASLDAHWSVRAQASATMASLTSVLVRNQSKTQTVLLATSLGIVLFLFFGLEFWLPSDYDSAGIRIAVLCAIPAASLQAIADGRAAVLMWMNRPGLVSISTAVGTLVTIALAYWMLPKYGWPVVGIVLTAGLSIRAIVTTVSVRVVCPQRQIRSYNFVFVAVQFVMAAALFATT